MRVLPANMAEALTGSVVDVRLRAHAWYDGQLVAEDLEIVSWSFTWSRGPQTQVQGQASFEVADPSGTLAPWGFDEPLSVAGSSIQAFFEVGEDSLELGEWVITGNDPEESWRFVERSTDVLLVSTGATIPVEADELTRLLADAKFMAPESPQPGGTVFSEIRRLTRGFLGVIFTGVEDRAVPQNMVYRAERINAVYDLAGMVGEARMTGESLLEIYDPARTDPLWELKPGREGNLITVKRKQSRDDIFNAVTAKSQDTEKEIVEWTILRHGPLRYYGPLGPKPLEKTSMADHRSGVLTDAQTTLANRGENATTLLSVTCAPNPAYQIGDWGQVACPVIGGEPFPLIGQVVGVSMKGTSTGMADMTVEVECSTADVQQVAEHVRRRSR